MGKNACHKTHRQARMGRGVHWKVFALLALVSLAGCLSGPTPDEADGWTSPADPIPHGGEHDHVDPAQHRFALNATIVDVDDLQRFGASPELSVGAHAIARAGGKVAVAVNGMRGEGQQGFHLFDVSDPADMQHLAFYDAGVPVYGDRTITFSTDGDTVFLGYERGPRPGVAAIDVSDPAGLKEVAFFSDPAGVLNPADTPAPVGFGPHTVSSGNIGGQEYVFYVAYGVAILRFTGDAFEVVGRYVTNDEASALQDAVAQLASDPEAFRTFAYRSVYAHDVSFFDDDGRPLLLVAYAYDGLKVLDLSDPALPVPVARWLPPPDGDHPHYVHSAAAARIDGRLIIALGTETFEPELQEIASPIWILDATDAVADGDPLAEPVHEGTWRNPGGAPSGDLHRSVHFFRIHGGDLYLSHYHGGVWAVGIGTPEERAAPRAWGYIMPVPDDAVPVPEECCLGHDTAGAPMVLDVEVTDDGVFAADHVQGLVALRFTRPSP